MCWFAAILFSRLHKKPNLFNGTQVLGAFQRREGRCVNILGTPLSAILLDHSLSS
jgi:hypothetical protein